MKPGAIRLHIGELVLHGFEQADRAALSAAFETELSSLLATGDHEALANVGRVARLDGGAFEMPAHAKPEVTGARLARAVFDGLTRQTARNKE